MCRPLHYLLLQPCASDAQAAAEKWVIQPWGSPALPLSLYPPLPQSPLLPLSLLPSSIHSLPLHPSPPFTHFPPDISSHMVFQYTPAVHLSFSLQYIYFLDSHLLSFSVTLPFPQSLLRFSIALPFHTSDVFHEVKQMTKRANGGKLKNET